MKGRANTMGKLVKRSEKTEYPGEEGADGKSSDTVPDEKHNDAAFGDGALFPGDFRMKDVGKNSGEGVRYHGIYPEKLIVIKNNASECSVDDKVKESEDNADDGEFTNTLGGLAGFGLFGLIRFGFAHATIISYGQNRSFLV